VSSAFGDFQRRAGGLDFTLDSFEHCPRVRRGSLRVDQLFGEFLYPLETGGKIRRVIAARRHGQRSMAYEIDPVTRNKC
jgi:hypothetical protein